jgi:hypothetical protein
MPDIYERINAQCPFFKTCGKYDITCEGVQPSSTTKTIFKEIASRSRYKATYCDRLYKDCRIYEMLEKKYEE